MRDALAERLLAKVMDWSEQELSVEVPKLQALASYKYDDYEKFSPGMRFVESLATWLSQFRKLSERRTAYEFVLNELLFCSVAEMNHFAAVAYLDYIKPLLIKQAAKDLGIEEWRVSHIAASEAFLMHQRECLFLAMSDGARIDVFRRSNPELVHDQILTTYLPEEERCVELRTQLRAAEKAIRGTETDDLQSKFRTIALLDDFSGSGNSILRKAPNGEFKGKLRKLKERISTGVAKDLVDLSNLRILLVLYVATARAKESLQTLAGELWADSTVGVEVIVVHLLTDPVAIRRGSEHPMVPLIESYYDAAIEDEHTHTGGTDVKYGYSACGLPLVLCHNTPNNSLALLWADEVAGMRPLFPRVGRHKKRQ